MSLRVFLPVSSAFRRVADDGGRFQPAEPGLVPDFSEGRGVTGVVAPAPMEPAASASSTSSRAVKEPVESKQGTPSPTLRRLPRWFERMLLMLVRSGNRRRGQHPVQSELGFESVRVARNDLATADVEVVMVKSSTRSLRLSPECRRRVLRLWWEEGSRRLRTWGQILW